MSIVVGAGRLVVINLAAVTFSFKENFTLRAHSAANSAAAMFSLLTIGLDWQLAILAGGVCLLAAVAAASLFARMRETSGRARTMWIVAGAVAFLCASTAIEVVAEQAYGFGLIAAGAVIGLGLGAGLVLVSQRGGRRAAGPARRRAQLHDPGSLHVRRPGAARLLEQALRRDLSARRAGCGSASPCAIFCGSGSL